MDITLEQFQLATGSAIERAEIFYEPCLEAMERFCIDDIERASAFLGTISVESTKLTAVEEDLYYRDPVWLKKVFSSKFESVEHAAQFTRKPKALSMYLYKGCHGRGLIQLSWERNYRIHGERLGFDYVANPTLLTEPWHAAMSAGSYWDLRACNDVAHDMDEVTLRVNGRARMHLAQRIAQRNTALEVLA